MTRVRDEHGGSEKLQLIKGYSVIYFFQLKDHDQ